MVETARLCSNVAKRLLTLVLREQLVPTSNDLFVFSQHIINRIEYAWAKDFAENHMLFLKDLHAQLLLGTSAWDPLNIVPMDPASVVNQRYSDEMKKLLVARIAKVVLTKRKFIGCNDGVPLIGFNGVNVSSNERVRSGWYCIL